MRYTFGTNETAAKRLQKMAEVFNPHSAQFIKKYAINPVISALDLGCGPGFTTQMLYMCVKARQVYGFDLSEEFIASAMERFGNCIFVKCDITRPPFIIKPKLMYMRFLLSHLPDPIGFLNNCTGELANNGLILVDELEAIETDIDVFKKYLSINKGLVQSAGAELFVGERLSKGKYKAEVLANEYVRIPVKNCDAAAMFYPNTQDIWEKEDYVLDSLSFSQRKEISMEISEIMNSGDEEGGITWKMRRIALKNIGYDSYFEMFI
jgi:trans-aconitate 2-methyltransferase